MKIHIQPKFDPKHQNDQIIKDLQNAVKGIIKFAFFGVSSSVKIGKKLFKYIKGKDCPASPAELDFQATKEIQATKELQTVTATQTITAVRTATLYPLRDVIRIYNFCSNDYVGDSDDYYRARKYSRFAAHSYPNEFEKDILPRNCEIIDKHVTRSGLRATLYNDNNEIICAFAGTKATSLKDWEANFTQVIGASRQYEDALEYGRDVCNRYPYHKVVFVGHSKGGGEAAYCAYNLGREAETFNPAGLSILTKYVGGEVRDDAIVNAYIFTTDILNLLQSAVGHGTIIGADGNIHYQPVANVFKYGIHGIKGILRYFKVKFRKP